MKEIKFRAWDKELNRMCDVIQLGVRDIIVNSIEEDGISGFLPIDRFEIMQYTGLKDKNGTEIYEGDIVKYTSELENGIFEVKYGKCRFYGLWIEANFMGIATDLFYLGCSNELEVIGNIYENPELLEEGE
ncbi:MAG: YopX family protein [Clostridium paraputrificum]